MSGIDVTTFRGATSLPGIDGDGGGGRGNELVVLPRDRTAGGAAAPQSLHALEKAWATASSRGEGSKVASTAVGSRAWTASEAASEPPESLVQRWLTAQGSRAGSAPSGASGAAGSSAARRGAGPTSSAAASSTPAPRSRGETPRNAREHVESPGSGAPAISSTAATNAAMVAAMAAVRESVPTQTPPRAREAPWSRTATPAGVVRPRDPVLEPSLRAGSGQSGTLQSSPGVSEAMLGMPRRAASASGRSNASSAPLPTPPQRRPLPTPPPSQPDTARAASSTGPRCRMRTVRLYENAPMQQSLVDTVVFGRDVDFSGETQFDGDFIDKLFTGAAGKGSWELTPEDRGLWGKPGEGAAAAAAAGGGREGRASSDAAEHAAANAAWKAMLDKASKASKAAAPPERRRQAVASHRKSPRR